jgi:argininosuccinate lyase
MKLWGGRFDKATDSLLHQFNASLSFDVRLYNEDITGSIAWTRGLARAGVLTEDETNEIVVGLNQVRAELANKTFAFHPADEDIHTAVERRLTELIGPVGGKLHTGRSRNDQVATDLRLYLLKEMAVLDQALVQLAGATIEKAEAHLKVIMPGYTHLQQAQPLLFSHWLMSFFWKFQRDRERLADMEKRASTLPLGAGALAGNPLGIDRRSLAAELNFATVAENSIDAVSDRDFIVEFLAWAALLQIHLSGLAEDLVIWSSREFGFVEVDDAYATGSSLMPQKKNPDSLELIRGKSGRMLGHLVGLLTTLKGLPSTYNKDLQEDKEALFDALDTLALELPIVTGVIHTLKVNGARMAAALDDGSLSTDLADYLVRSGVPFRQSHHLVGQVVRRADELGVSLKELDLADYQAIHPNFGQDVYSVLSFQASVEARDAEGGTAPSAVKNQIERAKKVLGSLQTPWA